MSYQELKGFLNSDNERFLLISLFTLVAFCSCFLHLCNVAGILDFQIDVGCCRCQTDAQKVG